MIARLIPSDGGSPIPLSRDVTVVGRDKEICDLFVNNRSVSKLHCVLVKSDGLLFVRDLGSTNGTKVNGQKITRGALLPGDQLAFASAKFKIFLGPGEEEPEGGAKTRRRSRIRSKKVERRDRATADKETALSIPEEKLEEERKATVTSGC
ncbi:MAG: FHA domain-containing protein [Planctomycetales bacterium]